MHCSQAHNEHCGCHPDGVGCAVAHWLVDMKRQVGELILCVTDQKDGPAVLLANHESVLVLGDLVAVVENHV